MLVAHLVDDELGAVTQSYYLTVFMLINLIILLIPHTIGVIITE